MGPPACYAADEGRKSTGYEEGTGGVGGHDDGAGAAAGDGQLGGQGKQLLSVGTVNLLVFIVFL